MRYQFAIEELAPDRTGVTPTDFRRFGGGVALKDWHAQV